ncbi:DUF5719 family protein [Paraoerskovia marina]|uniref:DUF5719 family protein n=1 Tax=Paraoerskovia marina TaxID=545619 RepID=UPI0012DEE42D|nr:DUF5719 family protein [Paraoerskovia marina]
MRRPTRTTVVSAVTGVLVLAGAGAVAAFGDDVPLDPPGLAVEQTSITVPPLARTLVCPAQVRMTDDESVGDSAFTTELDTTSAAVAGVVGDAPATAGALGEDGADVPRGGGAAVVETSPATSASWITIEPDGGGDLAAGAARSTTTTGDLRGLAAGECRTAGISQWLVGGSTEVGSSSQLVLQNPGTTPAAIAVSVWGPAGRVAVTGSDRFVVPPGEQIVTLLEGGAPEQPRTVVHVEAEGGLVTSYLQHSTVDGIVAAGVDLVTQGAEPATDLVVPGVVSLGEDVGAETEPTLRLLAPEVDATATLTLYGPDGERAVPGIESIDLPAGRVVDVGLGGLEPGPYTVRVSADEPVVAGVELLRDGDPDPDSTRGGVQVDRAWISAQAAGTTGGTAAIPDGTRARVVVAGEHATTATLTGYDDAGEVAGTSDLSLVAESSVEVPVSGLGDDVALVTVEGATWNVLLDAGDPAPDAEDGAPGSLLSALTPVPAGAGPQDVVVRVDETVGQG